MKSLTAKNVILTILQIPVLLVRLLVACVDFLAVKCLTLLDTPLSSPFGAIAANKVGAKPSAEKYPCVQERAERIRVVIELLSNADYFTVRHFRITLERTCEGVMAIQFGPNRHDYAVLILNKAENIRRIENVFWYMDSATLDCVLQNTTAFLTTQD